VRAPGVRCGGWSPQILEVAAFRDQAAPLAQIAARQGVALAAPGTVACAGLRMSLCVRPQRWLLLAPDLPAAHTDLRQWQDDAQGHAAVTDLSSALAAFLLAGPALGEMLARGCRLDLDPAALPPGRAAATVIAQVAVTLATLPHGVLLLTPATTARHFAEWLEMTMRPFGASGSLDIEALFSGEMAARYP
jgi:heterotetrameric sarcosine oxidase gamma subunit